MTKQQQLDLFFNEESVWNDSVNHLRQLALSTEVEETYKWQFPTYTVNGKNVFALAKFKDWYGIWFFQGVFLSDHRGVLTNAQEGKTKAMRHWKFDKVGNLPDKDIIFYMEEAIQNQLDGKVVPVAKKKKVDKPLIMPDYLVKALKNDSSLSAAFDSLSQAKKRGYADYITSAKQQATKEKRLEKIIPHILAGKSVAAVYGGK
jgi:uncharacterized protein YdeI (YjbR/CyaY-like superfamily)